MASVSAFTQMMGQFLTELRSTFPEETKLKVYESHFDMMKKMNARKIVEVFMESVRPYQDKIMAQDEKFLLNNADKISFLNDLNITRWWTADVSDNTKNAIWQYLKTLLTLGNLIVSIPTDTLKQIEGFAEKAAESMQQGEGGEGGGGQMDLSGLMGMMNGLLGGNK